MYVLPRSPWEAEWRVAESNCRFYGRNTERFLDHYKDELGDVILDIGCGPNPVTYGLKPKKILIDTASRVETLEEVVENSFAARVDLNKLHFREDDYYRYKDALLRASADSVNTIVSSSVLNYIDYKSVIETLEDDLEEDGLVFVVNRIDHGFSHYMHPGRPRTNDEIIRFFESELGHDIEFAETSPLQSLYLLTRKT